jgi:hypothetical protein
MKKLLSMVLIICYALITGCNSNTVIKSTSSINTSTQVSSINTLSSAITSSKGTSSLFIPEKPWLKYAIGSADWFINKYIGDIEASNLYNPMEYPLNKNFIVANTFFTYTYCNWGFSHSDYYDMEKYYDKNLSKFVIPQDIVETEMKKNFGNFTNYNRNQCIYYVADKKSYICSDFGFGSAETIKINSINKLKNNKIEIKISVFDGDGRLRHKKTYIMQGTRENYVFISGVINERFKQT